MLYFSHKNPFSVVLVVILSIIGSYVILWLTDTSLQEAQKAEWFFVAKDLEFEIKDSRVGISTWAPPAPFGWIVQSFLGNIYWPSFLSALNPALALSFIYLIRCSLNSAALQKNTPFVSSPKKTIDTPLLDASDFMTAPSGEEEEDEGHKVTLNDILARGYGYSNVAAAVAGGFSISPGLSVSITMFKLGAAGIAPQLGSIALLLICYFTTLLWSSTFPSILYPV